MTQDQKFELALGPLKLEEGEYSNRPGDKGGETKFGISKAQYPDLDIQNLTWDKAKAIYFTDFWMPLKTRNLDPKLTRKLFDMSVTFGFGDAARVLQRALRACADPVLAVAEDGKLGIKTTFAAQRAPINVLLSALRSEQAAHYRLVAIADSSQAKFLNGWLNRAYS